jgi:hypothetical protein
MRAADPGRGLGRGRVVRGVTCRAGGASAVNPLSRQARIHRSTVPRETITGSPNGPSCALDAISRTTRPRCRVLSAGSAASRISRYRNSATCLARRPLAFLLSP